MASDLLDGALCRPGLTWVAIQGIGVRVYCLVGVFGPLSLTNLPLSCLALVLRLVLHVTDIDTSRAATSRNLPY